MTSTSEARILPDRPDRPEAAPPQARTAFRAGPVDLPAPGGQSLFSGFTRLSFLLLVLVPVVLASLYFGLIARDRYAAETKFVIRSAEARGTPDILGFIGGGAVGITQSDSYVVIDYLHSRQFLDALAGQIDLRALFGPDRADPWMRLPPDATMEEMQEFLPRILDADFDPTSQIVTIQTQAFTPEEAQALANAALAATDQMMRALSETARRDSLHHAELELSRAETALRDQRLHLSAFREADQRIDPHSSAATQENLVARLQQERAQVLSEIDSLGAFLSPDSPRIRILQNRRDSLTDRIAEERLQIGSGRPTGTPPEPSLNDAVTSYDALMIDLEFRERAYLSALASLEAARIEADRQQRYIAVFVRPGLPQSSLYPRALLTIGMIGAVCFLIWGITAMFVHILREHLA